MDRRNFNAVSVSALASLLLATYETAHALSIADLTDQEASMGLKAALEKGAASAVSLLGQPDGFLGNEKVRIPLPGYLNDAARLLKTLGQGKRVDELVTAMNRAAEAAVPKAKGLLVNAVKTMNVSDAKNILTGGDTSVTRFFSEKTRTPLFGEFLPVVTQATQKVGLAAQYNQVAGKAASLGLVKKDDANIENYVTNKTLDGLFTMIGEEERKIRQDPVSAGSAILKKVFGAVK
ncbi:hypothetical protein RD110_02640 [Rhodoferax koreense]|uniref:DUF4197 domain-containing protein n=1 Tax=Rhodoferax koreensis TaxID=1842727 RepID=A0A1P8JR62_9BURK|nr:DUF4197 domain-containing protein [Rhodoferax koreense]APW36243.1 hypothetical protein RD110_02640 [Rhodoferax koreense]